MCTVCQSRHILPEFSLAWAPKQTGSLTNPLAWWALISDHFVDNVKWWSNYMTSQTRGRQLFFLLCCFVLLFHWFFFPFPTIYFSLIFYFLKFWSLLLFVVYWHGVGLSGNSHARLCGCLSAVNINKMSADHWLSHLTVLHKILQH